MRTRVFPEPGPATTQTSWLVRSTAARWGAERFIRSLPAAGRRHECQRGTPGGVRHNGRGRAPCGCETRPGRRRRVGGQRDSLDRSLRLDVDTNVDAARLEACATKEGGGRHDQPGEALDTSHLIDPCDRGSEEGRSGTCPTGIAVVIDSMRQMAL